MAKTTNNKTNESFEKQLFKAADKLRKNIDAAEYKHVVLGLVFLKYISDSFEELFNKLKEGKGEYEGADPEDQDEYRAQNVFWVPQNARWPYLHSRAKLPSIGTDLDEAMELIEKENPTLKGILAKVYARPNLDKAALGGLIDLISNTALGSEAAKSKDLLGRVYEYFLGEFANAEGKKGGQFYTPKSIVRLLVEMVEPYKGRVYDPACGSGGMFIMSEKFVQEHQGKIDDISIFGQESNQTTYRLARMNLAIRGIDGSQIKWNSEGSFLKDAHPDLKADFIIANPPFNQSDWGQDILRTDPRWQYGVPPANNANFGWMQHMIYHLAPHGVMGLVLANGSLSSNTSGEGEIRQRIVEADLVDCVVTLPTQLFYNTQISACLWFISRKRTGNGDRKRNGEILFINAAELGFMEDRTHRSFSEDDVRNIAHTYHEWRKKDGDYVDVKGFSKSASFDEVKKQGFVLSPSRYVGISDAEADGISFEDHLQIFKDFLQKQTREEQSLDKKLAEYLKRFFPNHKWDDLRFSSNEVLAELAQKIFHEWFIEFNFPNADEKPYKKSGGKMILSDMGDIPYEWDAYELRDWFTFVKGKKPEITTEKKETGSVPQILIDVLDGGKEFYTKPENMVICSDEDLIMVMDGASSGRIEFGFSGAIGSTLSLLNCEKNIKSILYFYLKRFESDIKAHTTGSAIPHTDKERVYRYRIALPKLESALLDMEMLFTTIRSRMICNRKAGSNLADMRGNKLNF